MTSNMAPSLVCSIPRVNEGAMFRQCIRRSVARPHDQNGARRDEFADLGAVDTSKVSPRTAIDQMTPVPEAATGLVRGLAAGDPRLQEARALTARVQPPRAARATDLRAHIERLKRGE